MGHQTGYMPILVTPGRKPNQLEGALVTKTDWFLCFLLCIINLFKWRFSNALAFKLMVSGSVDFLF